MEPGMQLWVRILISGAVAIAAALGAGLYTARATGQFARLEAAPACDPAARAGETPLLQTVAC